MFQVISKISKSELLVENQLAIKERLLCKPYYCTTEIKFILVTGNFNLTFYINICIFSMYPKNLQQRNFCMVENEILQKLSAMCA